MLQSRTEQAFGHRVAGEMVWIAGGPFRMGSDRHYPEEAPVHRVSVNAFWIDRTPVTNRQFKEFVEGNRSRYPRLSIAPDPIDYPGALPHMVYAGSLVFKKPEHSVDLRKWEQWWTFLKGATWRHPYGPKARLPDWTTTQSFTSRFLMRLPIRGGSERICRPKPSGSSPPAAASTARPTPGATRSRPNDSYMANTWQGEFPWQNLAGDGFELTAPVDAFPPNGYGVYDMIGNVWEWTTDWFNERHAVDTKKACCTPENPRGAARPGATIRASRWSRFRVRCSRAAHTCVRRTTAAGIGRPPGMRSRLTRQLATLASGASPGKGTNHECRHGNPACSSFSVVTVTNGTYPVCSTTATTAPGAMTTARFTPSVTVHRVQISGWSLSVV